MAVRAIVTLRTVDEEDEEDDVENGEEGLEPEVRLFVMEGAGPSGERVDVRGCNAS